jgi:hypothetical protein
MRVSRNRTMWTAGTVLAAVLALSGCAKMEGVEKKMEAEGAKTLMVLSGAQEVPPVNTQASGRSSITVVGDKVITGQVETSNINATAAHIHEGASGQNGPVIIPLVKTGANVWSVPGNTVLSSSQFDSYRAGNLYINVHSAANPAGEIRGQLKP